MLEFNEERHEYKLDGVIIPSVTQVIQSAGLSDFSAVNPELLERAAKFGTAVHKAIELHCKGKLESESLDEKVSNYLQQWKKFCLDYRYKSHEQEYRAANHSLRVGFCVDNLGTIDDSESYKDTIVDVKTGNPKPSDIIQVSAYGKLYPVRRLMIVYLKEDRYLVIDIKLSERRRAEIIFNSCLNIYHFKKEHRLI